MQYLFTDESGRYVLVNSTYNDYHENIKHIFSNIITKLYDWIFICSAENIDIGEKVAIIDCDFDNFFAPSDFVDVRPMYGRDDTILFNALFYEIDSFLLRKLLECFNVAYIMEEEDREELIYFRFMCQNGRVSRSDVDFSLRGQDE